MSTLVELPLLFSAPPIFCPSCWGGIGGAGFASTPAAAGWVAIGGLPPLPAWALLAGVLRVKGVHLLR